MNPIPIELDDDFVKQAEEHAFYESGLSAHGCFDFMRGKTCPILDNGDHGVYSWDLQQFLNLLKKKIDVSENKL